MSRFRFLAICALVVFSLLGVAWGANALASARQEIAARDSAQLVPRAFLPALFSELGVDSTPTATVTLSLIHI